MSRGKYVGIITSLITPFAESGGVNYDVLEELVRRSVDAGLHGVMVAGTAGEYPNLTDAERRKMARHAVRAAAGRVPVIVHTGHVNREAMLALTRDAEEAGADAVMVVAPPISQPTQAEIEAYFREVAAAVAIDVVIYENPGRVGVSVGPETLLRLAGVDNIVAIKDSGRNLRSANDVICQAQNRIDWLSGEGDLVLPLLAIGASGAILTGPNVTPVEYVKLYEAWVQGNLSHARALNQLLRNVSRVLSAEGKYHAAIKAAMREIGLPVGSPRRPLTDVSDDAKAAIRSYLTGWTSASCFRGA